MAFKGGHYLLHQLQFPGWGSWQPLLLVDFEVKGEDFFFCSFGAEKLDGRLVCLWVQLRKALLAASADHSLCLFPPFIGSMPKHLVQHDQPVVAVLLPLGLPLQEQLYIHDSLCFSY